MDLKKTKNNIPRPPAAIKNAPPFKKNIHIFCFNLDNATFPVSLLFGLLRFFVLQCTAEKGYQ